jgi:hypothetical protein
MADADQSGTDVKLSWEIRKLQAEVEALNRPFKNPSVIAALMTATLVALVSCGGLLIQWSRSDRDYTLAQIRTERLKLESDKLQAESEVLQVKSKMLQAESEHLQAQRIALESEVAARRHNLQIVSQKLKKVEAALAEAKISDIQQQEATLDLMAATAALRAAAEMATMQHEAARVYYVVDTYKNLANRGIIERRPHEWSVSRSRFASNLFVGASLDSLSEIIVPAPAADVTVLTGHDKQSWRNVPISSDRTKIEILNPDRFWARERYLVVAIGRKIPNT